MRHRFLDTARNLSCRLYGFLLPLYPRDLRYQFGPDMADVFEQQIRSECKREGYAGVARVWFSVTSEIIQGILPNEFLCERVAVPIISLLASLALFAGLFLATGLASRCMK